MAEAVLKSDRQRAVILLYAEGRSNLEIEEILGLSPQMVTEAITCAAKHLAREFPSPTSLLPWVNRSDLLRAFRGRFDPEPMFEDLEPAEGETTAIHGRPYGMCPADLAPPPFGSPGEAAVYFHGLLCRLRQVTQPERPRALVEDVPKPPKPAVVDAERERKREARKARRARRRKEQAGEG